MNLLRDLEPGPEEQPPLLISRVSRGFQQRRVGDLNDIGSVEAVKRSAKTGAVGAQLAELDQSPSRMSAGS